MSRESRLVWLLPSLLLAAGGAYWVSQHLVAKTETVWTPPGREARDNPLLAAHRYFERMGQRVESIRDRKLLQQSPPDGDTLLLYRVRPPSNPKQLQALYEWVERGGTLIVDAAVLKPGNRGETRSLLLSWLGVGLIDTGESGTERVDIDVDGESSPVSVRFGKKSVLEDRDGYAQSGVEADGGFYVLDFHIGDGVISLVNDLNMISNRRIGKEAHAFFLHLLAAPSQTLWLLYDPSSPSLLMLAWQHTRLLLFSVLLLGVAALWAANRRIGPLLPPASGARRDLGEHIAAMGRFDRRNDLVAQRLAALRRDVEQGWLLRYPVLDPFNREQRAVWIARHTRRDSAEISAALYPDDDTEAGLVRQVALLQRLRHWSQ